ncbi:chemotaxis protein [Solibacillus sp. FSL H8-0523]|uniref:chemotaxis protein n=1 Tax=Solibacillus sp. FSL H8-0523 TaxID=2954511 RepID=UPI00310125FD
MKKTITTMSALLLLSATLAACNTDTTEPATTTAADEKPQTEQTEANTELNTEQTTEPTTEQANKTNEPAQTTEEPTEQAATLTYSSLGKTVSDTVTTSTSKEMNYTIAHFDNFTLQAEEPGVDQLIFNNDDQLSMQINVITKEDVTFDDVKASAAETMAVISADITELDFASVLEQRTDIINLAGYETVLEETDKVVKIVFERDNMFVTLTIYDTAADLQDAFLQMGLTIQ